MNAMTESSGAAPPLVTVVIPARNEATAVGAVVTEVRSALERDRRFASSAIVVVDDGSTDETGAAARAAGAGVLRNETARGYGAALKRGIRSTAGRYVCIVDADLTYPVSELPAMLALLDEGADQVVGVRTAQGALISPLRRFVKRMITAFAGSLARRPIADLNSGLRCFRRELIEPVLRLFPDGFSFTTTLTMASLLDGWEVRWHPIGYRARAGASKFRPVRDTLRLLVCLVRAVLYFDPLKLFLPVATGLGVSAVALGVWDVLWERNVTDKTVLLSLAAIVVLTFGLIGNLVVKKR